MFSCNLWDVKRESLFFSARLGDGLATGQRPWQYYVSFRWVVVSTISFAPHGFVVVVARTRSRSPTDAHCSLCGAAKGHQRLSRQRGVSGGSSIAHMARCRASRVAPTSLTRHCRSSLATHGLVVASLVWSSPQCTVLNIYYWFSQFPLQNLLFLIWSLLFRFIYWTSRHLTNNDWINIYFHNPSIYFNNVTVPQYLGIPHWHSYMSIPTLYVIIGCSF